MRCGKRDGHMGSRTPVPACSIGLAVFPGNRQDTNSPCFANLGTSQKLEVKLLGIHCAKSCQNLACNVQESQYEIFPKHQRNCELSILIHLIQQTLWSQVSTSKHTARGVKMCAFHCLKSTSISPACPQEITRREVPKAFSPVSRGKSYLINAAMTLQICASQPLPHWLVLSLAGLSRKCIFLKYIHKC